ncbi:MAG: aromatic-ring-hydroxylating dioxygenase subunit beta, partial [Burkholderiales bacterium]
MSAVLDRHAARIAAEDLIYREARLLDEKKWQAWLALYTEDALFWMPSWASEYETTSDPELELNLIYLKGRAHLEDRVFRLETGESFASMPMARTTHVVGGVIVDDTSESQITARASWRVHSFGIHGGITRGGWYEYVLRRSGETFKIARKKITMIDDKL